MTLFSPPMGRSCFTNTPWMHEHNTTLGAPPVRQPCVHTSGGSTTDRRGAEWARHKTRQGKRQPKCRMGEKLSDTPYDNETKRPPFAGRTCRQRKPARCTRELATRPAHKQKVPTCKMPQLGTVHKAGRKTLSLLLQLVHCTVMQMI